jgi:hypothetical protein
MPVNIPRFCSTSVYPTNTQVASCLSTVPVMKFKGRIYKNPKDVFSNLWFPISNRSGLREITRKELMRRISGVFLSAWIKIDHHWAGDRIAVQVLSYWLLTSPTFGIGSQNDRIIGAAIDNLDKASDQESARFQLDQRPCAVHRLSDQGTLP